MCKNHALTRFESDVKNDCNATWYAFCIDKHHRVLSHSMPMLQSKPGFCAKYIVGFPNPLPTSNKIEDVLRSQRSVKTSRRADREPRVISPYNGASGADSPPVHPEPWLRIIRNAASALDAGVFAEFGDSRKRSESNCLVLIVFPLFLMQT